MIPSYSSNRPDFSDFLVHFTKDASPIAVDKTPNQDLLAIGKLAAKERLIRILRDKRILATPLPWVNRRAVCFTECPWASLLVHARQYSHYGIGFGKPHVFAAGGGPAYYVRADHYEKQQWEPDLHTFVTPFWPAYIPLQKKALGLLNGKTVDFSHEREWRVPHTFEFEYNQVEFVIVKSYEDVAQFPKDLKDEIGRAQFLIMDIYEQIESLWPVHRS